MSNKVFDILKWVCLTLFPAASVCAITILTALGYGHVEVVAIILGAVETFFGSILGASSISYYKNQKKTDEEWESINVEE